MAVESAVETGFPDVWIHGKSVRVDFMHNGTRHRHAPGIEPTKVNLRHAARLRSAAPYALRTGACNEAEFFPHSRPADTSAEESKRLCDLYGRYMPLKAVDITKSRCEVALNACLNTIGRNQTRHTYACWNLTARGNLAFIANQMGHADYSMLVKVYSRWIDSESPSEPERIWAGIQNLDKFVQHLSQETEAENVSH